MRKLLWIGDAVASTGFAKATHNTLEVLRKYWDVSVLGINYDGDPHSYPYPIYPAMIGGDAFGIGRTAELVSKIKPDVVVLQQDPWNFKFYKKPIGNVPCVGAVAVDGKNCRGSELNGVALAIFWTKFGEHEARIGGYDGPTAVVPLGVDLEIFKPVNKKEVRKWMGLEDDMFIVGNVNRNQPRKRFDLLISYFADWIRSCNVQDAYLYLHVAPTQDAGYDVKQLAQYYGISNRMIISESEARYGVPEKTLARSYCAWDVNASTTQGEGFGLTTFEAMACGVPCILPRWSALEELCKDHAMMVECSEIACTPNSVNAIGGIPDREQFVKALDTLYRQPALRAAFCQKGLSLVTQERFRWSDIGENFHRAIDSTLFAQSKLRLVAGK